MPIIFLAGSWLLSKLMRCSFLWALCVGALPAAAVYLDLPFAEGIVDPLMLVVIGWALVLALAVGRFVALQLLPLLTPSSMVSGLFTGLGVIICGALTAVLWFAPHLADRLLPLWQSALGTGLLLFAVAGFTLAFVRAVRGAIGVGFWLLVCIAFAGEVFLQRTPREILSEQFRVWAQQSAHAAAATADVAVSGQRSARGTVRVALVQEAVPGDETRGSVLRDQLEARLNARTPERPIEVVGVQIPGASIIQIRERLAGILNDLTPDLVVFGSWFADAEPGQNSVGLPGLTERQALAEVERVRGLAEVPLVGSLMQSYVAQAVSLMFRGSSEDARARLGEVLPRVPPVEYADELRNISAQVASANAVLVLAPEPAQPARASQGQAYLSLLSAPAEDRVVRLSESAQPKFAAYPYDLLFENERVPTSRGAELWAQAVHRALLSSTILPERVRIAMQTGDSVSHGSVEWITTGRSLGSEISITLSIPEAGVQYYRISVAADGVFLEDRRLNDVGPVTVRFRVPPGLRAKPVIRFTVSVAHSPPAAAMQIGNTEFFFPLPLTLVSDVTKGEAVMRIAAQEATLTGSDVMSVAAVDLRSGIVRKRWTFGDDLEEATLIRTLRSIAWGEGALVALRVPFMNEGSAELASAFAYLGIHELPEPRESFVAVGVGGMRKKQALVARGTGRQQLRLTSDRTERYSTFAVRELAGGEVADVEAGSLRASGASTPGQ